MTENFVIPLIDSSAHMKSADTRGSILLASTATSDALTG